jgi:heat shock protein HslJ
MFGDAHDTPTIKALLRYAALSTAVLAIAWPTTMPDARTRLSGSEWRPIEIDGKQVEEAGTVRFTKTSVRGKAACNRYFGAFRETGDNITIEGLSSTRMHCPGRMALERALLSALERAKAYRIENNTLVLFSAQGQPVARLAG